MAETKKISDIFGLGEAEAKYIGYFFRRGHYLLYFFVYR